MKQYYIGNEEVTEEYWNSVVGDAIHAPYVSQVRHKEISIDDVPDDYRAKVAEIVAKRNELFGEWAGVDAQQIAPEEALSILLGGSE